MKSEGASLSPVVDELMLLVSRSHCVPGGERDVEVALREALENAVFHGNRGDPTKQVYIGCRCEPGKGLSIVVRDQGEGFDLGAVQHLTDVTTTDLGSEHGIPLMRQLMDEVYYELGGRELHMRKRSDPRKDPAF